MSYVRSIKTIVCAEYMFRKDKSAQVAVKCRDLSTGSYDYVVVCTDYSNPSAAGIRTYKTLSGALRRFSFLHNQLTNKL